MPERDEQLLRIRPHIPVDTDDAQPIEAFQNETLRPILKLQNPILLMQVAAYLKKYNTAFPRLSRTDKLDALRNLLKEDNRLKRTLIGLVAGHFTEEEYAFYLAHRGEVRRRLVELLLKRMQDQVDMLPVEEVTV